MVRSNRVAGIIAVFLSVLFFYLGSLPIKWAKPYGTLGGTEFIFVRFLLGTFLISVYLLCRGRFPKLDGTPVVLARAVFHFLAGWLYYVTIELSNAALGNVLHMTYPLFAAIFLLIAGKSKTPLLDLTLSGASVAGIMLTASIAGSHEAVMLGLLSGVCGAMSVILLSSSRQGNSTVDIFFYTFLGGVALCSVFARPHLEIHSNIELGYLALSSILGIAGQFTLTYGAAFIPAVESSVLSCTRIPLALLGASIGLEALQPTIQSWIGALLIFAANIFVIRNRPKTIAKPALETAEEAVT